MAAVSEVVCVGVTVAEVEGVDVIVVVVLPLFVGDSVPVTLGVTLGVTLDVALGDGVFVGLGLTLKHEIRRILNWSQTKTSPHGATAIPRGLMNAALVAGPDNTSGVP